MTAAGIVSGLAAFPALSVVRTLLYYWLDFLAVLAATFIVVRWVDGLDWRYVFMGRKSAAPARVSGGFLMGLLAIGVPCAALLVSQELRAVTSPPGNWFVSAAQLALFLLPAAAAEELLMRGYVFSVVRETAGWKTALIGTSIVFGLLHVRNPGANAENIIVVIVAGFFLGTVLLVTESLYAAWMAHFAWNWTMAAGLHTSVSGLPIAAPNYHVVDNGPAWLTGGAWGPEGGVAAALGMFAFLFYLHARYRGRLQSNAAPRTPA